MVGNKIANKITKASRASPQHNSETLKNKTENIEVDREIPKERNISLGKRQQIIDDLRLM